MIRLFIFSLLTIVLALWVTLYLGFPGDPGYLLISFGNYTFETSLFALLIAAGIIYLLVRLLIVLVQWINPLQLVSAGRRLSARRKARARSNTVEGLLSFARGNWQSSYRLLTRSARDKDATVINYLAAAYAAQETGNKDWVQLLERAEREYPAFSSTIKSVKAQLLYRSGQLEQCLAVLEQLRKTSVNDTVLLSTLKDVYLQLQDWQPLQDLLPVLEKNKVIDVQELEQLRMRIFMEQLYSVYEKGNSDTQREQVVAELLKRWRKAPSSYREDERVVDHFFMLLFKLGAKEEAAKVIDHALSHSWSRKLIARYGELDFTVSAKQLLVAEGWLKSRPADADLMLSLGRLSMRNQLWGKAREYFEASIKIAPSAPAYGELGRLLKHLGEVEAGEACLENYSDLLGIKLPELPLPAMSKPLH